MALLPFLCHAESWQLSVVEKGVVDGVHVMSIEPPFTDDLVAYNFALYRPCPQDEPLCAVLFVRPDAPLPPHIPAAQNYYPQVMAYKVESVDWRADAYRCLFPTLSGRSFFPCLNFQRMTSDFLAWQTHKLAAPESAMAEIHYIPTVPPLKKHHASQSR